MQKISKILTVTGILAVVVVAGILIGWWGSRDHHRPSQPPADAQSSTTTTLQSPSSTNSAASSVPAESGVPENTALSAASVASATATNPAPAWEEKLDDILGSDGDDTNKVKQLFELFPRLPEDGQTEVAQHLSNLVPDEDYAPLGQLLGNAKLPESVLDALMSDLLNRPNSVKLPELLQVAQTPDHAKADEAKDLLELYLDENDPAKWPQKMKDWLKDNPD
jgi:hypothetical protein